MCDVFLRVKLFPRCRQQLPFRSLIHTSREIKVACKTPATLLEEATVRPSEVDILAIDAEGLDVQILTLFLKFLGCEQHAHLLIHVSNHPHILGVVVILITG